MPIKESLYDIKNNRKNEILHTGYNYRDNLFMRSMSHLLFQEDKRYEILKKMEKIMVELIDQVKTIKTFYNYAVNKNYRDLN